MSKHQFITLWVKEWILMEFQRSHWWFSNFYSIEDISMVRGICFKELFGLFHTEMFSNSEDFSIIQLPFFHCTEPFYFEAIVTVHRGINCEYLKPFLESLYRCFYFVPYSWPFLLAILVLCWACYTLGIDFVQQ